MFVLQCVQNEDQSCRASTVCGTMERLEISSSCLLIECFGVLSEDVNCVTFHCSGEFDSQADLALAQSLAIFDNYRVANLQFDRSLSITEHRQRVRVPCKGYRTCKIFIVQARLDVGSCCVQIVSLIRNNSAVVIEGSTGSGKTTQVPQVHPCGLRGSSRALQHHRHAAATQSPP